MTRDEAIAALTAVGQPYELQVIETERGPISIFVNAPRSLRDLYERNLSDATFIVYNTERLTFFDAYRLASKIAHVLVHDCGVKPGDRVAISMRNYPEWILAFTAITSIGAIAVGMNSMWQHDELIFALRDTQAKVVFADDERVDQLNHRPPIDGLIVFTVRTDSVPGYAVDLAARLAVMSDVPMPPAVVSPTDLAIILYTSGSTGRPKGALSTHRNVVNALLTRELEGHQQTERTTINQSAVAASLPLGDTQPAALLAVPLFHVSGLHAVCLASYRAQRKLVCMYKWDATQAVELIEREHITNFSAPPAITGDLLREAKRTQRNLDSLLTVGGGGAARMPDQVFQIESSFANAHPTTGWGMTETNSIATTITGIDYLARPLSSGRAHAVVDIRVVDGEGNALPAGERGELEVRGTPLFVGYWNRPDATVESLTVDGCWFRSGDLGYIDDEGFIFVVDRIKDLIIRGGENVGCGRVEAMLLSHPKVHEACVYGVPDERLGEEVAATVCGESSLEIDELRAFLSERLARYEVPRYLYVSEEPLPRTGSGKVLRRQLRDITLLGLGIGSRPPPQ